MHGLGLCVKLDSFVVDILYAWSFINNTSVIISVKQNKYVLYLNKQTTMFDWVAGNLNKNRT